MNCSIQKLFLIGLLLGILLMPAGTQAQSAQDQETNPPTPLVLTDAAGQYPLGMGHVAYLVDPAADLTISDVSSVALADQFRPGQAETLSFGYTAAAVWLRFRLDNRSEQGRWLVELPAPYLDRADFFAPGSNGAAAYQPGGDLRPFSERAIEHRNFVFEATPEPGAVQTYYLRVQNKGPLVVPLQVWQPETFFTVQQRNALWLGLFYGIVLITLIFHVSIYLIFKDTTYLRLSLLVLIFGSVFVILDGLAYQYLWPNWVWLNDQILNLMLGIGSGLIVLMVLDFLPLSTNLRRALFGLLGIIELMLLLVWITQSALVTFWFHLFFVGMILLLTVASGLAWWRGHRPAFFVLLFAGIGAAAAVMRVIYISGLAPATAVTVAPPHLFYLAALFFLTMIQVDRVRLLRQQNARAQRQLKESNRHLRQYLEALPVGVAIFEQADSPTFLNQSAKKVYYGQNSIEATAQRPPLQADHRWKITRADSGEPFPLSQLPHVKALHGEAVHVDDLQGQLDGQTIPLEIWAEPLLDGQGRVHAAMVVLQDISRRRQLELERAQAVAEALAAAQERERVVKQQAATLEREVANRTQELTAVNAQLKQEIAERRLVEQLLRENQTFLERVLEYMPVGLQVYDQDGFVVSMNRAMAELLGFDSPDTNIGTFNVLTDPASQAIGVDTLYQRAYRGEVVITEGYFDLAAAAEPWGTKRQKSYLKLTIFPLKDDQRDVSGVAALVNDITEVQQTREAYQVMVDFSSEGLLIFQDDWVVFANPRLAEITGYSIAEIKTEPFAQLMEKMVYPEDIPVVYDYYQQLMSGETTPPRLELRTVRPDASILWLEMYVNPITYQEKPAFYAVFIDVTERKRIAERNQALLAAIPDLMFLFNSEKEYIDFHAPNSEDLYIRNGQFLRKTVLETLPPDVALPITERMDHVLATGEMQRLEYELVMAGQPQQYEARLVSCGKDQVLVLVRNISERKKIEADLRQAKEQAERANRAKSAFLANMSHELRTPLSSILGYAYMLGQAQDVSDVFRERAGIIEESGNHLLMLINDILDIAKIEAGVVTLNPTPFNLFTFLKNITNALQIRIQNKALEFHLETGDSLPTTIYADERRLRQILMNLLGNAIKFTQKGDVILRVKSRPHPDPKPDLASVPANFDAVSLLRFEVEDRGPGISPENLENIFLPFEQTISSTGFIEGSGLGLAISQHLARLMNSEIAVKSEVGRGSLFWLDLSLPVSDFVKTRAVEFRRTITGLKIDTGVEGDKKPAVLVIDDTENNRIFMRDTLERLGFAVSDAADSETGLALARQQPPDIIISALRLPGADGNALARQIRASTTLQEIPLIAISAGFRKEDRQESLAAGFDAFLSKPVDLPALLDTIEQLLDIEWIYEEPTQEPEEKEAEPLPLPPPPAQLDNLRNMASVGDIGGIQTEIEAVQALGETYKPFVQKIQPLIKQFKISAIQSLLKQYYDENESE